MEIIFIVGAIVLIYVLLIIQQKRNIKRLYEQIREEFGQKPDIEKRDIDGIENYWKEYSYTLSEDEKIDDITWNDLDMNSVFWRINNCKSFVGEQTLYSQLHHLSKNKSNIELLDKKISFFSNNNKQREKIQVLLYGLGKDENSYYLPVYMKNLESYKITGIWKFRLMQILLAISVLPAIVLRNPKLFFITVSIFFINVVIYSIVKVKYDVHHDMINTILNVINIGNIISDKRKFYYEDNFGDLKAKAQSFKKLSNIISFLQIKKKAALSGDIFSIAYDYIIGATLWEIVKYDQIMRTLDNKRKEFMELYKAIGEIDMAITLASFRKSLPLYCIPDFSQKHILQMKEIFHPLIDEPVLNTVTMDNSCIITGSNASGKSTYIKSVAINVILAQTIYTCMAKKIIIPYAKVITSMAVRDNLLSGESYYIKEIKYLKRIIDSINEDRFVICVIDEILRGTNTEERIAASASILKYLHNKNCIALVASHDIELTQILDNIYDNYHFTEQMKENDIKFDYKIYNGPSYSKNAIKLLKYVGFPDEIITGAKMEIKMKEK